MSFLFGPKIPKAAPPVSQTLKPPAKLKQDEEAIKEKEKKRLRGGGSRQTILTSSQGILEAPKTDKKVLLGE